MFYITYIFVTIFISLPLPLQSIIDDRPTFPVTPGRRTWTANWVDVRVDVIMRRGEMCILEILWVAKNMYLFMYYIFIHLSPSLSLSPPLLADITGEREMYYLDNLSIQEHLFVHAIYIYSIEYSCHSFPAPSSTVLTLHCNKHPR